MTACQALDEGGKGKGRYHHSLVIRSGRFQRPRLFASNCSLEILPYSTKQQQYLGKESPTCCGPFFNPLTSVASLACPSDLNNSPTCAASNSKETCFAPQELCNPMTIGVVVAGSVIKKRVAVYGSAHTKHPRTFSISRASSTREEAIHVIVQHPVGMGPRF